MRRIFLPILQNEKNHHCSNYCGFIFQDYQLTNEPIIEENARNIFMTEVLLNGFCRSFLPFSTFPDFTFLQTALSGPLIPLIGKLFFTSLTIFHFSPFLIPFDLIGVVLFFAVIRPISFHKLKKITSIKIVIVKPNNLKINQNRVKPFLSVIKEDEASSLLKYIAFPDSLFSRTPLRSPNGGRHSRLSYNPLSKWLPV